jgi:hypothetical protein
MTWLWQLGYRTIGLCRLDIQYVDYWSNLYTGTLCTFIIVIYVFEVKKVLIYSPKNPIVHLLENKHLYL